MTFIDNDLSEFDESSSGGSLDRRECPHCGLMFRLDEAKPSKDNKVKCPYCDWAVEQVS